MKCKFFSTVSKVKPLLFHNFRREKTVKRIFLLVLYFSAVLISGCMPGEKINEKEIPPWQATPLNGLDLAFQKADPQWLGADSVSSVPLGASRILWLFGDTLIQAPTGGGRKKARIIRNSLAIQMLGKQGPERIRFYWHKDRNRPVAVFLPKTGPGWLWPLSGFFLKGKLYLFYVRVVRSDTVLGFEIQGSLLITVQNPRDPPAGWKHVQHEVPFFHHGTHGDLFFGVACMVDKEQIYIYGIREDWNQGMEGRSLLVARAPSDAFPGFSFSDWHFFSSAGWSKDPSKATALFDGAATEMSVNYMPFLKKFAAVYTYCGLSGKILMRTAPHPQGPWGKPMVLWTCPEESWSKQYFCYAGKDHPEIASARNEIVISYACNSSNPENLVTEPRLYWPRFVKVTFQK